MFDLDGYHVYSPIYSSANSTVYRAVRYQDRQPVILKVLQQDSPTPQDQTRYRQEYDITRMLNLEYSIDGVIKIYDMDESHGHLVLVLEDFDGISLNQAMQSGLGQVAPFSLDDFLTVALQMTDILGSVHQANVIHKDINPANILIHPETKQVKLIDFGISTVLSRENPTITNPNVLEGTLAYISPEQTGRMNRSLDYRTDFYSLGVSFYELLTGTLPFDVSDPLELVHCHIAHQPRPIHELKPSIPPVISQIVSKLMAKTAEDRYQSAWGIQSDLENCQQQRQETGSIAPFPLGRHDIANTLQIPQKLYGRDAEVQQLLDTFHLISNPLTPQLPNPPTPQLSNSPTPNSPTPNSHTSELILVAGYSGIGKSSLVQELYKPITQSRGYFIAGKFDQFQRNIPYSAIVEAFQELVRQLLTESEEELAGWRDRLLEAVGNNGHVLIDVIPEFELIIGAQPVLPELGAAEQQNRFNLVFQGIIEVFSTIDHPLVLFLDDLQWVDAATLKLMELILVDAPTQHLLVIGAYRDNEVQSGHPLTVALTAWAQQTSIHTMTLPPLTQNHVTQLVANTLQQDEEQVKALSHLVMRKTQGNPFFVNEFLRTLYSDHLLNFNRTSLTWQWDMERIEKQGITDNVVDLMVRKIQKLSPSTQSALKVAACIGASFSLARIAGVLEQEDADIFCDLKPALNAGLINPVSGLDERLLIQDYVFSHDRIQQAAYTLLDDQQRQSIHFTIGKMLLKASRYHPDDSPLNDAPLNNGERTKVENAKTQTSDKPPEDNLFTIVNQLNMGLSLLTDPEQNYLLAQLNVEAGNKAQQSNAYEGAIAYFQTALTLLGSQRWHHTYELTLSAYQAMASTYYSMGAFDAMQETGVEVLSNAQSLLEKVPVYAITSQAHLAQGQFQNAVTTAIEVANLLGVTVCDADLNDPLGQIQTIETLLGDRTPAELIHLPAMESPQSRAALQILSSANSAAYVGVPRYLPSIVSKQVQLLIKEGHTPLAPFVYAWYGTLLCGPFAQVDTGYAFGQLALELLKHDGSTHNVASEHGKKQANHQNADNAGNANNEKSRANIQPKTAFMVNCMIVHWQKPVKDTLAPLMMAYQEGRDSGDVEYASWAILVRCEHLFCMGRPLNLLEQEMQVSEDTIRQFKQDSALFHNNIFYQATLNLLGKDNLQSQQDGKGDDVQSTSGHPYQLSGSRFNDQILADFKQHQQEQTGVFHAHLCQLHLAYLFEQYDDAIAYATAAEPYKTAAAALFAFVPFHLYDSLAHLAVYPQVSLTEQEVIAQRIAANQQKMRQWATHAPENHQQKYELVEAEWCRVQARYSEAMDYYDRAIASANANGFIHEEALACELAAKFYVVWGKPKIARVFLKDAYQCYLRWGAIAKVHHLETNYADLLELSPPASSLEGHISHLSPGAPQISNPSQLYSSTITARGGTQTQVSSTLDLMTVLKSSQTISSEIVLDKLLAKLMQFAIENAGAEQGLLVLVTADGLSIEAKGTVEGINTQLSQSLNSAIHNSSAHSSTHSSADTSARGCESISDSIPGSVVQYVQRTKQAIVLADAAQSGQFTQDPYVLERRPKSILCAPILDRGKLLGLVYLENNLIAGTFTRDRLDIVTILASQAAISLENALLYRTLEDKVEERTAQLANANQEITALNQRLEQENNRLTAELEITQQLQQMILPNPQELEGVGDLDIAGFMAPADEVGGDYYDVLQDNSPQSAGIKIGIGDVTGHGLESGVLMLMVQTAVRTLQESGEKDPIQFLDIVNRTLYKNIERMGTDKNLTLSLLDYDNGQLRLSGQHEELIIVRCDGTIERFDTIDLGFPIGLDMDISDFISHQTVFLERGDVAVLYTDGITEAENKEHKFYGIKRLCDVVRQHAHQSSNMIRQEVISDVHQHIGNHTIFDDITLVILKRQKTSVLEK
ncbi:MAG: AAA family ATPase [Cyanobacteria bacterium P01_F01_bin.150]